jgi:Ca2+-binding RTX toxin-like protein
MIDLETINAGEGDDIVDLTSDNFVLTNGVTINGEAGNDTLWGSNGDDTIDGGAGNDTLFGGAGSDTLTGGTGSDVFQFTATAGSDVITDFDTNNDAIQLYYRATDNHTNADLNLVNGILTWNVDDTSNDVLIDVSATVASSDLNDLDSLITFVEIV